MKKITKNIGLLIFILISLSLVDIFDNSFIEYFDLKNDDFLNWMLDTGFSFIEIGLTLYLLYLGKRVLQKGKEKEKQYRRLIDLYPEAILIHKDFKILYANQASATLIGANSYVDLIGQNWKELFHFHSTNPDNDFLGDMKNMEDLIENHSVKVKRVDGKIIDLEINSTKIEYNGGTAREVIAKDVTYRNVQKDKVKELVYQDELTKLPNRRFFLSKLDQIQKNSFKANDCFAIMFLDLDGFKSVNDLLGHDAGDELLKKVSLLLKNSVRENDFVARLGGDEFTILLPNADKDICIFVAERIISSFQDPFFISNKEIRVTPSIGIAQYSQNDQEQDISTLLKQADSIMYEVKKSGKNSYKFADKVKL
ncbi:diguanylate cyclase domain-containing protein [Psychrobacillus sp. L4]|uniref:diguanylate cyclase domain-containing protein n=1 Tax=Psychrobacillus sp. L4 TaxID=3236892 RepID=UPI0036F2EC34